MGVRMIIQGRDQTRIEHYLKRKFFIRPFVCSCCGNKIMLEHGYSVEHAFTVNGRYYSNYSGRYTFFGEPTPDKICEICSKDVIDFVLKEKL